MGLLRNQAVGTTQIILELNNIAQQVLNPSQKGKNARLNEFFLSKRARYTSNLRKTLRVSAAIMYNGMTSQDR